MTLRSDFFLLSKGFVVDAILHSDFRCNIYLIWFRLFYLPSPSSSISVFFFCMSNELCIRQQEPACLIHLFGDIRKHFCVCHICANISCLFASFPPLLKHKSNQIPKLMHILAHTIRGHKFFLLWQFYVFNSWFAFNSSAQNIPSSRNWSKYAKNGRNFRLRSVIAIAFNNLFIYLSKSYSTAVKSTFQQI